MKKTNAQTEKSDEEQIITSQQTVKPWVRGMAILLLTGVSGWLIMEMEILAGRMLAPFVGNDIYTTWGSVIGVFLLSLSVGYMLGGRFSRVKRSREILGLGLIVSGLWLMATPLALEPICYWLEDMGLGVRMVGLGASVILFAAPTILLGTVSPTAIQWLTREVRESGLKAGMVLAFSTAASFAGCLVTAWYLTSLSLRRTVWISGGSLSLVGCILLVVGLIKSNSQKPVENNTYEASH
ncbi:MAG: fused MFS/spermidine synthase [Candidatus Brocadiia bacterium]